MPVALQLRLAEQQGRLLWWSPQTYLLLEAPGNEPRRGGSTVLRWLDQWWDLLLFVIPPVVLLSTATIGGLTATEGSWRFDAALLCALAAATLVLVLMSAVAIRGFLTLYRILILGRPRDVTDSGVGQVIASHWSVPLCVLPDATSDANVAAVLDAVQRRVADLARQSANEPTVFADVIFFARGLVSLTSHNALLRDPRVESFTADPPVLILRASTTRPLILPPSPPKAAGRLLLGVPWLIGGMAVVIAVLAQFVAQWERQECETHPTAQRLVECADLPQTYRDALYWLLNRLFGGDPSGLGADSTYGRSLGLLVTLMGVVVVGGVITSLLQQAVQRTQRFGQEVVDAYNEATPASTALTQGDASSGAGDSQAVTATLEWLSAVTIAGFTSGLILGLTARQRRHKTLRDNRHPLDDDSRCDRRGVDLDQ